MATSNYHPVVTHLKDKELKKFDRICRDRHASRYAILREVVLELINSYEEISPQERKRSREKATY